MSAARVGATRRHRAIGESQTCQRLVVFEGPFRIGDGHSDSRSARNDIAADIQHHAAGAAADRGSYGPIDDECLAESVDVQSPVDAARDGASGAGLPVCVLIEQERALGRTRVEEPIAVTTDLRVWAIGTEDTFEPLDFIECGLQRALGEIRARPDRQLHRRAQYGFVVPAIWPRRSA